MPLVSKTFSQIITFTRASTATFFNSAGVLTSAAIDAPRFDFNPSTLAAQGLLIEESRTNSIRNNTMVGAVAGTPGTEPTNWSSSGSGSGITRQIVGTGTENGIAYIDVKFSGTPSAGTSVSVSFEQTNQIAASAGQTWSESVFVKLQAGSFSNTATTISLLATDGTSGTEAFNSALITSTPADLRNCRVSITGTLAAAIGTTHVQPRIRIGYTVGVAFDITLRVGLPQLEQGAFATSVIPTTTTALTRAADVASVNTLSPWYNASAGTLFAEFAVAGYAPSGAFPSIAALSDNTNSNRINMASTNTGANLYSYGEVQAGGVSQAGLYGATGSSFGVGSVRKSVIAYATNDFAFTTQGVAVQTDTSGTVPTVNRLYLGVAATGNAQLLNGYLRRIVYYPRRLSDAELQSITS